LTPKKRLRPKLPRWRDGGEMNSAAVIAVPRREQPAPDPLEAAFAAAPALRSVEIESDAAPVRPPRPVAQADVAVLNRPRRDATHHVVPRAELYDRLSGAARVTQLSAAAGSGKTVLLRSWIDHAGLAGRAAWVLLDHDERDAQRFWLSVLSALRRTTAGRALIRELMPAPDLDGWTIVERLIEDLTPLGERIWLVIDDLDELHSDEALHQLEWFVKWAPPEVRFVLSSRREPHLGLHRLRVDGELTEIRTPDLRFTPSEARTLVESSGVQLSAVALAQLLQRTEGWAGGLRLAAMSLATRDDPEQFAAEFSGSERTVAAYLVAEVLERQPAEVRELLLYTSLLERVSGPLADHLTGGSGADRVLQELEDANAFVSSVDAPRTWFRYQHLFADLLRLELRRMSAEVVRQLHCAASDWFEHEGYPVEAVRHAQLAGDWHRASRLLFDCRIGLILDGRLETLRALLDAFPARVAVGDPELAVVFAGVRIREGAFDDADAYVAVAERNEEDVQEGRKELFGLHLASVRLALARQRGDLAGAVRAMRSLESALDSHPPNPAGATDDIRALALMTLGTTELWSLRLMDARRHLEDGLALARRIGRPYLEIGCLAHLGIAAPLSGLSASVALAFTEGAVTIADAHGLSTNPIVALAFAIGAGSLAWLGRPDEAEQWLERAGMALRPGGDPGTELAMHHARGLLYTGQGRLADALAEFRSAEKLQGMLAGEHALMVDLRARIMLTQVRMGELSDARAALDGIADPDRDRAEVRIPTAAIQLADGSPEEAIEQLAPVTEGTVESLIPTWAAVHALLFEAAAREEIGDRHGAEASLERALDLAEPEGLILPFTIVPVEGLLERYPRHRTAHAAFLSTIHDVRAGQSVKPPGESAPLLDELSEAELRIVRYLPSNLKAPEIAAELFVSTNTIRTHLRHIYAKLDAHSRAEAVDRARELGLLAPSRRRR
jgi:LuxR family transcriptional regulator, maltose regulon positive regulatory protein